MVIGLASGLLGLGLALPTGMAFGYGYGYGVRAGYSAFRPPSKNVQDLKMSPNPVNASLGMGLQTAEERTGVTAPGVPPMTDEPSLVAQTSKMVDQPKKITYNSVGVPQGYVRSPTGQLRLKSSFKSYEEYRRFVMPTQYGIRKR